MSGGSLIPTFCFFEQKVKFLLRAKMVLKCVPTGRNRGYGERGRDFLPERREEEEVGGGIRGREGMVAVNNMIQNNI